MNDLLCQIFSSMVEKMQDFLQMFSLHSTWCFLYYSPEGGVMQAFLEKAYYSSGWFIYVFVLWPSLLYALEVSST